MLSLLSMLSKDFYFKLNIENDHYVCVYLPTNLVFSSYVISLVVLFFTFQLTTALL